jgi:hypothetical protein
MAGGRVMTTPGRPYRNTASGLLAQEAAAERARRNGISPPLATSRQAGAAVPTPAVVKGTVITSSSHPEQPVVHDLRQPPTLKGAVRVDHWPTRRKYPFRQIAEDGGIWRMDPAAYGLKKPESLRTQANAWARKEGLTAKTAVDGGQVYVQFINPEAGAAAKRRAELAGAAAPRRAGVS